MVSKKATAAVAPAGKATSKSAADAPAKRAGKSVATPPTPSKPIPATIVTLKHLAAELAPTHELSKKAAETVVDDIVGLLVSHLKAGDRLRISGLGILEVKHRAARSGRNPATGAAIQIAASKKIAFRAAKELKEAI